MTRSHIMEPTANTTVENGVKLFAYPATPQQQQLWFLDELCAGTPAYDIPLAYDVRGILDMDALDQSLRWMVNRHETLRTVFSFRAEEPSQIVRSEVSIAFVRVDLSDTPETEKEATCRRIVADEAAFRFNLAKGPLIRGGLLKLDAARHLVIFNFHHITLDHLSVLQFAREFWVAYDCFHKGQILSLEPPAMHYPAFATWQKRKIEQADFQSDLQNWVQTLKSVKQSPTFPPDHPSPLNYSFTGKQVSFSMTPDVSATIRAFAGTSKKSLDVTLLTLFKCLLARYSGEDDVVVGTPFANRSIAG